MRKLGFISGQPVKLTKSRSASNSLTHQVLVTRPKKRIHSYKVLLDNVPFSIVAQPEEVIETLTGLFLSKESPEENRLVRIDHSVPGTRMISIRIFVVFKLRPNNLFFR
eukprot:TRINITY_DN5646_c0_g2_i2.p1 TRINITY_DN5646_c0_g2~~TRINITY_DN5646_c0_g2_i2.p1  ORF type:complete len:109 (-),score=3.24 TRINITY_DN5646_c0_g2_i2:220-546(-)